MRAMRFTSRVALAALAVTQLSCGLFDTRDPQEPEPPSVECLPLTSALNVKANVEISYGRDDLRTCYESMLDVAFLFHPDPQDSLQNPDPFLGWNRAVEAEVNTTIAGEQSFIAVDFPTEYQDKLVSLDQNTEVHFLDYVVRVRGVDEADTTRIARFIGRADITFRRGITDVQWRMVDWADHRGPTGSDSTWGLLRSSKRQGGP